MNSQPFNSCLYRARVMHHRLAPKKHDFHYEIFMFYLDLDEIDRLHGELKWMSRNKFNLFNFRDSDHLQMPQVGTEKSNTIRQHITAYLFEHGIEIGSGRIMVLTNLNTLGYQFNPVSFYYCYDDQEQPLCAIAEVGNTFREIKPYFLGKEKMKDGKFHLNTTKYFYVSPFIDMDTTFDFVLQIPDEKLNIKIDDYDQKGNKFFISTLTGKRVALNDATLIKYFLSFPMITLKVITLIHWHALKLWIKKLPYHKKSNDQDLQKDIYRPYKS